MHGRIQENTRASVFNFQHYSQHATQAPSLVVPVVAVLRELVNLGLGQVEQPFNRGHDCVYPYHPRPSFSSGGARRMPRTITYTWLYFFTDGLLRYTFYAWKSNAENCEKQEWQKFVT